MAFNPKPLRKSWASEKRLARYNRSVDNINNDYWQLLSYVKPALIAKSKLHRGRFH